MDGFRADYLKRGITHSVSRILECGSSAKYMLPSFPSKTFPNHFTIVTGLYPESHGIVDNHFYDEYMPNEIWNTVAKNGKKSAVFFWPGSEVAIQGILPTYRFTYDSSKPFYTRAKQVIDWLQLEESERPSFLAMYFEQPDTAMHREGPDSDAVNSALIYVDAMINYLMHQLDDNDPQVGGVFGGTIGHINFRDSTNSSFIDQVLAPMTCLGGQKFRVYTRYTMPMRYHYTRSSRIGEIVIDSTAGGRVFIDQKSLKEHGPMEKGDHGYDNRMREMRALFGAWGPSIKNGYEIEPFQNIELYNLFTGGGY
uniref:NUC domain-containing protein n=1 Tax=Meloidogyne hapla TaxID=6305 RepID=A0A1I8C045_MELHA